MTHLTMWHSLISFCRIFIFIHQLFSLAMAEPLRSHNIQPANIPFIASLAFKLPDYVPDRGHFCTGSLITKNLVLTAAHCLENKRYDQVDVVIGTVDLQNTRLKYDVDAWITFERWNAMKKLNVTRLSRNDIAIVKLKTLVEQPSVIPANITKLRDIHVYGKNATLIGWIKGPDDKVDRFLRKANVQILTVRSCEERFQLISNEVFNMPEGLLCTVANPFTIVTKGDSGGPLLDENNNILAINRSFCIDESSNCSEEMADQNSFSLHTDLIDEYRQFINDIQRISS